MAGLCLTFPPLLVLAFAAWGKLLGRDLGEGWPEQTEEVRGWLVPEGPFP